MKPVVRSLKRDIRRMVTVPAAWIVIIGLLFVPALYAWFNIVGFGIPIRIQGRSALQLPMKTGAQRRTSSVLLMSGPR